MAILNTSILIYITGFVLIAFTAIYIFFKNAYSYWSKLGVPFIPGKYIFGSITDTLTFKTTMGEEMSKWYFEHKAKGHRYVGAYFFHNPFLMIIDRELVKNVMARDFNHFVDHGGYSDEENDPLSAHLFSLNGLKWKHLRQKLTPTFTSGKLKKMFQTLVDCTEELKNCLDDSVVTAEPIDIKKILAQYTTDVIGSCAFGLDCNSFKNPNSEFIQVGQQAFNPFLLDRIKLFFAFLFPSAAKFFKMRVTNKHVDYFFRNLVYDTIEYREKNNVTRNDFMQLLIQLKNKGVLDDDETTDTSETVGTTLTMNEAAAQAFIFFLAGFETSSTTMTFCLYELSKNKEIQDKARKEIVSVLKKYDGQLTYDCVYNMHYLERVILETLRIHPPVMALQREVTQEYVIPETNLTLKNKLGIFIPILGMHMDPEFYPDPEKFEPDRFTEENKASRPDFTFLPFGEGPRVCIGLRFGMMQTKVGICRLLCNYKFTLNPKTCDPLVMDPKNFVRGVKDGVWLNAEKITT